MSTDHPLAEDAAKLHNGSVYRNALIGEHLRFCDFVMMATNPASLERIVHDESMGAGEAELPLVMVLEGAWECEAQAYGDTQVKATPWRSAEDEQSYSDYVRQSYAESGGRPIGGLWAAYGPEERAAEQRRREKLWREHNAEVEARVVEVDDSGASVEEAQPKIEKVETVGVVETIDSPSTSSSTAAASTSTPQSLVGDRGGDDQEAVLAVEEEEEEEDALASLGF